MPSLPGAASAQFRVNMAVVTEATKRGGTEALKIFAVQATNEIKRLLTQPHSGPIYPAAPGKTGGNPASLPGEPPALQTGHLRSGYVWKVEGEDVYVGTEVEYAPALEFGTSTIEPRPHFRPGLDNTAARMTNAAVAAVTDAQAAALKATGSGLLGITKL